MTIQNLAPTGYQGTDTGEWPCEGGITIRIPIALDGSNDDVNIDLSALQSTGHFSAAQTIFVDNSNNAEHVHFTCNASQQTFIAPPFGFMYMPILQPNPPKFVLNSPGAVNISIHFINFFLPPVIWGPDLPSSGSIAAATPHDDSGAIAVGGAAQIAIAANIQRVGFLISNPTTATEILQVQFGVAGTPFDLLPGATYETGVLVWKGDIYVNAATAGHAFTAYEGTSP